MGGLSRLRHVVDLMHLQSVCERNYWRLRKLLPALPEQEAFRFWLPETDRPHTLELVVRERSPYTDTLHLTLGTSVVPWCPRLDIEVRLYHDACMAEVLRFQRARRIPARNRYPNPQMQQRDEKTRVNEFLAESLEHCLREGYGEGKLPLFQAG